MSKVRNGNSDRARDETNGSQRTPAIVTTAWRWNGSNEKSSIVDKFFFLLWKWAVTNPLSKYFWFGFSTDGNETQKCGTNLIVRPKF
jgi:hypothetical protein